MLQVYNPEEWTEFQSRLIRNHREIWNTVRQMDYADAVPYLNSMLGTNVAHDALLKDAAKIFMNALLKKEGTIILPFGRGYSK